MTLDEMVAEVEAVFRKILGDGVEVGGSEVNKDEQWMVSMPVPGQMDAEELRDRYVKPLGHSLAAEGQRRRLSKFTSLKGFLKDVDLRFDGKPTWNFIASGQ